MVKKLILALSITTLAFTQTIAQNIQIAFQLIQSCYVTTNGKVTINVGGHYTTAASEQVYLRDSLRGSIYDTVNSTFKNNKRNVFAYDSGGLLTSSESMTLDKNGVSWSNSQKIGYKYTGFQLFEESYKSWDKALIDWVNNIRNVYSYETDNTLSSIFNQTWDADTSEWKYVTRNLINYDQNKNVTSIEIQKWNKNLVSWENYQQLIFTYSGGYISEITYQIWNKTTLVWDDYQKESISYVSNNKSEVILQLKSGTSPWENSSRNVFVYSGSVVSDITEYLWNGSWKENRKYIYTYNANNLESTVVTQNWAAHLNSFRNQSQDESFYTQREVFGIDEIQANTFTVINPLSKHIPFSIGGLQLNIKYQVSLLSLNGSLILNKSISAGETIALSSQLPSGIYMLSIASPGTTASIHKVLITD